MVGLDRHNRPVGWVHAASAVRRQRRWATRCSSSSPLLERGVLQERASDGSLTADPAAMAAANDALLDRA
jgi:hypothetical protein